jgi:membrane protein implicated in regulation of membrane protease activity
MLIVALVLAVIGLAALVTAVVTSNELIAWVCIGASVIGVLLLIVDALRERNRRDDDEDGESADAVGGTDAVEDYPDDPATSQIEVTPGDDVTAANALVADPVDEDHKSKG